MLLSERPPQLSKTFGISVYLRCNSAVYSGWDNSKERGGSLSQIREMEGQGEGQPIECPLPTQELTVSAVSTQDSEKTGKTNDTRETRPPVGEGLIASTQPRLCTVAQAAYWGRHVALIAFIRDCLRGESTPHKSKSLFKQSAVKTRRRGWVGKQSNKSRRQRRAEESWNWAETHCPTLHSRLIWRRARSRE